MSVIIPVYNEERYLRKCLDSMVSQTLRGIEAIVVNDGSRDGSEDIIAEYAEAYPGLIIPVNKKNEGVSAARNAGLKIARGQYIGFADADDYAAPDMYRKMYGKAAYGKADLTVCRRYSIMRHGKLLIEKNYRRFIRNMVEHGQEVMEVRSSADIGRLLENISVFIWDKLFDRAVIQKEGLTFTEGNVYGEDFAFSAKYLTHVKRAAFVDEPLYYYNAVNELSTTRTISQSWYNIYENLEEVLDYYDAKGLFSDLETSLCDVSFRYYDRRVNSLLFYGGKVFQYRFVKYSQTFMSKWFPGWKKQMLLSREIVAPFVKVSLPLMAVYIFIPNVIKQAMAMPFLIRNGYRPFESETDRGEGGLRR